MPITSIAEKIDRVDVAGTGRQNGLVAMAWTPIGRSLWVGDGSSIAFAAAASNLVLQRFPVLYLCRLLPGLHSHRSRPRTWSSHALRIAVPFLGIARQA